LVRFGVNWPTAVRQVLDADRRIVAVRRFLTERGFWLGAQGLPSDSNIDRLKLASMLELLGPYFPG
jgi:hypothetical protein